MTAKTKTAITATPATAEGTITAQLGIGTGDGIETVHVPGTGLSLPQHARSV